MYISIKCLAALLLLLFVVRNYISLFFLPLVFFFLFFHSEISFLCRSFLCMHIESLLCFVRGRIVVVAAAAVAAIADVAHRCFVVGFVFRLCRLSFFSLYVSFHHLSTSLSSIHIWQYLAFFSILYSQAFGL